MNPLALIRAWLDDFAPRNALFRCNNIDQNEMRNMSRAELHKWLVNPLFNSGTLSLADILHVKDISLALDCLNAAGIGREGEQESTVACEATAYTR